MHNRESLLQRIVATRREAIARAGYAQGIALPAQRALPITPFCREPTVVCEIKERSPSRVRFVANFDPLRQAEGYLNAGARAISVLTEERYFGGALNSLVAIKERFPRAALLRKDFLFDREDVKASYYAGADAVLLIAAILSAEQLAELYSAARTLGLEALVEVHSREEIAKIRPLAPSLMGINCRNLHRFTIDLLDPLALSADIDWPCRRVFESGISAPEHVRMACEAGFDSLLIGESAMRRSEELPTLLAAHALASESAAHARASDPAATRAHSFWATIARRRAQKRESAPARPLVKICGLTQSADAKQAVACGADLLGLIFCASPRRAKAQNAYDMARFGVPLVAVVDGEEAIPAEVLELYREGYINALQIHGGSAYSAYSTLACSYYYALRIASQSDYALFDTIGSPRILLDSYSATQKGGTGVAIAHELLDAHPQKEALWLAGGIGPENIASIITRHSPELVDISSRVEKEAGIKDHHKIRALFEEIDNALL